MRDQPATLLLAVFGAGCVPHEATPTEQHQRPLSEQREPDVKALCFTDPATGSFVGRLGDDGTTSTTITCGNDLVVPCEAGSVQLADGTWSCACDLDYLDGQPDCADAIGFVHWFRPTVADDITGRCVASHCEWVYSTTRSL